jgi:hypothetical protein
MFSSYDVGDEPALCVVEVSLALCAADVFIAEDTRNEKGVRFDVEECVGTQSSLPKRAGEAFIPGPAYSRKCFAARVAARQRAIDLASGWMDSRETSDDYCGLTLQP